MDNTTPLENDQSPKENPETPKDSNPTEAPAERKPKQLHNFGAKEEINEENCKFTEGQILKFVRVRFPGHARSYAFLIGKRNLTYGQKVMAMSDRGMAVGYINSFVYELPFEKSMLPLKSINKIATEEDIEKEKDVYKRQKEIETTCQGLIEKHNLDMNLTHVEFTQYGKKVVFYFVAPARVDFRGLVKDLVSQLKLRIELRQISVRDRAASMGAIGPCGRELCCSSFLGKYGNVSIKMAKNQNLTLNYSKLNGVCGQLKCCLQYEDQVYGGKRKKLPKEGDFIKTKNGDSGKVHKLNILSEQFDLLSDKGVIKRFTADQVEKTYKEGEYKFPYRFDNISDETANIIGLNELDARKSKQFQRDIEKLSKRAKRYAEDRIDVLADYLPENKERPAKTEITEDDLDKPEPDFQEQKTESTAVETKDVNSGEDSAEQNNQRDQRNKKHHGHKNNRRNNHQRRNKNHNNNRGNKPSNQQGKGHNSKTPKGNNNSGNSES